MEIAATPQAPPVGAKPVEGRHFRVREIEGLTSDT